MNLFDLNFCGFARDCIGVSLLYRCAAVLQLKLSNVLYNHFGKPYLNSSDLFCKDPIHKAIVEYHKVLKANSYIGMSNLFTIKLYFYERQLCSFGKPKM